MSNSFSLNTNGGVKIPKKICVFGNCQELVNYPNKYCKKHKLEMIKKKKEKNKKRMKIYDQERKDDKEWKFYKTREWKILRISVLNFYAGLDLYFYYMENKIVYANTSHHIIEIRDDWDKRLDFENQFPCTSESHKKIHDLYEQDKVKTQKLLLDLLKRWKTEVKS